MFIGTILGIVHGVALPVMMLIFGDLTNAFINQDISNSLSVVLNSNTVVCGTVNVFNSSLFGLSVLELTSMLPGTMAINCSFVFGPNATYDELLVKCVSVQAQCLTDSDFISTINIQVYIFVGIAAAVFLAATVEISFFQVACERQVHKIRLLYYRAILRQEIGWFDANPSGELASRLSE